MKAQVAAMGSICCSTAPGTAASVFLSTYAKQALLFKGLRVHMGLHTGVPDALQVCHC